MAGIIEIAHNVERLKGMNASPAEIDAYLAKNKMTAESYAYLVNRLNETGGKLPQDNGAVIGNTGYGPVQGVSSVITNGVLMGLGDEVQGAYRALTEPDTTYTQARAQEELLRTDFMRDHPMLGNVLHQAGAVGGIVGSGGMASELGAGNLIGQAGRALTGTVEGVSPALQAVAGGAAVGGIAGASDAQPGQRLEGFNEGAAGGALFGGGAFAGIKSLGAAAEMLRGPVTSLWQKAQSVLGHATPPPRSIAAAPAGNAAALRAMEQDNSSPSILRAKLASAREAGQPVTPLDVAPEGGNLQGLGRQIVTLPGAGRATALQALQERAATQPQRVLDQIEQASGQPIPNSRRVEQDIIAARDAAAKPLYASSADTVLDDPELLQQLQGHRGLAELHSSAANELSKWTDGVPEPLFGENAQLLRAPTVRDIDLMKRALDAHISHAKGINASAMEKTSLGPKVATKRTMMDAADALAPDYAKARSIFSDATQAAGAVQQGRELFAKPSVSPYDVEQALAGLDRGDVELFRAGALDAIRGRIKGVYDLAGAPNSLRAFFGNQNAREAVRMLFDDAQSFAKFERAMRNERDMAATYAFMAKGSQTANKIAEADDAAAQLVEAGAHALHAVHSPVAAVGLGARLMNAAKAPLVEARNAELAKRLYSPGEEADAWLEELEKLQIRRKAAQRTSAVAGSAAGGASQSR